MNNFESAQFSGLRLRDLHRRNGATERLAGSLHRPGVGSGGGGFRGLGLAAESLPAPDAESLRLGRRYTSGKECLPMPLTLGSLLQRLERAKDGERFVYLMPSTNGPCRFGVYNLLNNIVLERLGWRDRVRIWSPKDSGYFDDMPAGTEMLIFAGIAASDLLLQAKLDVRPVERVAGQAEAIYRALPSRIAGADRSRGARQSVARPGVVAGGQRTVVWRARIAGARRRGICRDARPGRIAAGRIGRRDLRARRRIQQRFPD